MITLGLSNISVTSTSYFLSLACVFTLVTLGIENHFILFAARHEIENYFERDHLARETGTHGV